MQKQVQKLHFTLLLMIAKPNKTEQGHIKTTVVRANTQFDIWDRFSNPGFQNTSSLLYFLTSDHCPAVTIRYFELYTI